VIRLLARREIDVKFGKLSLEDLDSLRLAVLNWVRRPKRSDEPLQSANPPLLFSCWCMRRLPGGLLASQLRLLLRVELRELGYVVFHQIGAMADVTSWRKAGRGYGKSRGFFFLH
jgi:hypothetical protein